ncbi:MAG: hypothetical protein P9X24_00320 [Candidatus Hatepunaea meridiana]|nr:hypothetical protein [Candidatus Hatepunaea meridiana]
MKVIAKLGCEEVAIVYIAETNDGRRFEFVESVEPPIPREKKWVGIVSTLFGCPVRCPICDAGINYSGKLSCDEILFQIDYLVRQRFPDGRIPVEKWKIQFARMGDPAFNINVLDVLEALPERYDAPGLMPSISTIAPKGTDGFFTRLLELKRRLFPERFQFQFSIHSTNHEIRRRLIPVNSWSFSEMAEYGEELFNQKGRKITLNFALIKGIPIDPDVLVRYFNPDVFLIKITPLNPNLSVAKNGLNCRFTCTKEREKIVSDLKSVGYDVIVSLGELEENAIGSNCGQYVSSVENEMSSNRDVYTYLPEVILDSVENTPFCHSREDRNPDREFSSQPTKLIS